MTDAEPSSERHLPDSRLDLCEVLKQEHESLGLPLSAACETQAVIGQPAPGRGVREADKLAALMTEFHRAGQTRTALCLSGGGIRSATFNLGVLQRLAAITNSGAEATCPQADDPPKPNREESVLEKIHFLSTVSGGGYIGGWLSAWSRRSGGLSQVRCKLAAPIPSAAPSSEAPEVTKLRQYSRYLTPRAGLMGGDLWAIVSTYLRNLLITWVVLIPVLGAVVLLPRLLFYPVLAFNDPRSAPGWCLVLLGVGVISFGGTAFGYAGVHQPSSRRFGLPRADAGEAPAAPQVGTFVAKFRTQPLNFFLCCLTPIVVCAYLVSLLVAWQPSSSCGSPGAGVRLPSLVPACVVISLIGWWLGSRRVDRDRLAKLGASIAGGVVAGVSLYGFATLVGWIQAVDCLRASPAFIPLYATFAVPLILMCLSAGGTMYIALVSWPGIHTSSDEDREWWARFGGYILIVAVVWIAVGLVTIILPAALALVQGAFATSTLSTIGGGAGVLSAVWGYSWKTASSHRDQGVGTGSKARSFLLSLAAPVFVLIFFVSLSYVATWGLDEISMLFPGTCKAGATPSGACAADSVGLYFETLKTAPWWLPPAVGLALVLMALGFSSVVDLNRFSMHGMYRERLIRAYLGASNPKPTPDPLTGFDADDNVLLHELACGALLASDEALVERVGAGLARATPEPPMAPQAQERASAGTTGPEAGMTWLAAQVQQAKGGQSLLNALRRRAHEPMPRWLLRDLRVAINRVLLTQGFPAQEPGAADQRDPTPSEDPRPMPGVRMGRARQNRLVLNQWFPAAQAKGASAGSGTLQKAESAPPAEPAEDGCRPLHIINAALNLVQVDQPAWQDRKAQSFTMSPLHCGSADLDYRHTVEYGGPRGISLGTAMAVSGAAVSPNMGYHSNPAVTFVLTLFNVRLGCWLGNPGTPGDGTYAKSGPATGLWPLLFEAMGRTNKNRGYVYLSDGGHFENLGLYEMVRRRCRQIIVCDAGCDPRVEFDDLGNAVRKIRADFGIDIEFQPPVQVRFPAPGVGDPRPPAMEARFSIGRVRYGNVDLPPKGMDARDIDGWLLYIKPSLGGLEPVDVHNYGRQRKPFPHESTADQFFSESQFESYRALGRHMVDAIAEHRRQTDCLIGDLI